MEDELHKIISVMKDEHLSEEEKDVMRKALIYRIHSVDQTNLVSERIHTQRSISPWSFFRPTSRFSFAFTFLLLFSLTGTTVVLGAEQSLPGDPLFAIKTGVNESVLRALNKRNPVDSANIEATIMERRLLEAEQLEEKQKLNTANELVVEKAISDQKMRVRNAISVLSPNESGVDVLTSESESSIVSRSVSSASPTTLHMYKSDVSEASSSSSSSPTLKSVSTTRSVRSGQSVSNDTKKEKKDSDSERVIQRVNLLYERHKDIIERIDSDSRGGEREHTEND